MLFTETFRRPRSPHRAVPGALRSLLLLAALPLAACADVRLPTVVFDDGPVPGAAPAPELATADAVLTGQRSIRRADGAVDGFPTLASVPGRPTAFSSPVERQALIDRLRLEQAEADRRAESLRGTIRPAPAATVPAPSSAPAPRAVPGMTADPVVPSAPPPVPRPLPR